jgi:hypothetical protein
MFNFRSPDALADTSRNRSGSRLVWLVLAKAIIPAAAAALD